MKYSILIPVYNTSKYLRQCLDSVLAQDYTDFEVILVNDGSTDSSPAICEEYSKKDIRIKYYSKANSGLLLTRRYSLTLSRGEYILFLDSDDYWDANLLSTLDKIIVANSTIDLLLYRFRRVSDEGVFISNDNGIFPDGTIFTADNKNQFLSKFVESSRLNTMWTKCVRRDIIDIDCDYSIFKDRKGEDLLQSIALIKNSNTIYYTDTVLMNYRLSPSGRGRNFKIKYFDDFEVVREHVLAHLQSMSVNDLVLDSFYKYYYSCFEDMLKTLSSKSTSYSEFQNVIGNISHYGIYKKTCRDNQSKTLVKLVTSSFCNYMFFIFYRLKYDIVHYVIQCKK